VVEVFFQQIKPFLTVQEQIDLFLELQKRGSLEAGFLAFLSLTAIGFSRRKPEKLFEARRILKKLNLSGLDSMPLVGCLDLLLADIDQASARFSSSSDENLRDWLSNYPGEKLEAICIFCKNWLENDVLVGYRDIDVNEVDLDLPPRVSFANNTYADLFVSIHANASRGKRRDINGLETFYYRGWRGKLLAKNIQKQILRVSPGSPDRGVKQGRFYVIKNTRMPAVLVEIGFLTGRLDARRLEKTTHRKRLAYAIAKGILEYFNK